MLTFAFHVHGQGIDVSRFQGKIDWRKVAGSGQVQFVYIKATEGTSMKDPYYKANLDSARAAGILAGSYHVYSSKTSADEQFANFKSVVSKKKQDLIPVLDIEGYHSGNLSMSRVDRLLELMETEYGVKPMIYTSEALFFRYFDNKKYEGYPIFIARYKGVPRGRYLIWQHSYKGSVPGISGRVDLDIFHPDATLEDLMTPRMKIKLAREADSVAHAKDSLSHNGDTIKGKKTKLKKGLRRPEKPKKNNLLEKN